MMICRRYEISKEIRQSYGGQKQLSKHNMAPHARDFHAE